MALYASLSHDITKLAATIDGKSFTLKVSFESAINTTNGSTIPKNEIWMCAISGTSASASPPSSSTFYRVANTGMEAALFLTIGEYTCYTAYYDSSLGWQMYRNALNIAGLAVTQLLTPLSGSPIVVGRDCGTPSTPQIRVVSETNAIIRVYDRDAMHPLAGDNTTDGTFAFGGNTYNKLIINRNYTNTPIATGQTDGTGFTTINVLSSKIPASKWVVVSSQVEGKAESFCMNAVQMYGANGFVRQLGRNPTATTTTRIATNGNTEILYNLEIVVLSTAETAGGGFGAGAVSQSDFYISRDNATYTAITSTQIWLEAGRNNTVFIEDRILGAGNYKYWIFSTKPNAIATVNNHTAFTTMSDAIARGLGGSYAKTTVTIYSDWKIGSGLWTATEIGDCTKLPDGKYADDTLNRAFTVVGGLITAVQNA